MIKSKSREGEMFKNRKRDKQTMKMTVCNRISILVNLRGWKTFTRMA